MTTNSGQYAPVFLPRETPPWQPQSTGSQRVGHDWNNPARIDTRVFLPVAALPQWELSVKMAQLLSLWGPWRHQVCRDILHHRSYGPIRVFFQASCSWRSVGLFGQSFSVAPPIQARRGFPCLGSFSVVQCIRHIEGSSWLGSYSVVQCIRYSMGQPLYCSVPHASMWGERGSGDGSTPYTWLSRIALLPWLLSFPPQAFPLTVCSLTSPQSVSHSLQQPSSWDYSTIPKLKLPAAAPSRGPSSLSRVCIAAAKTVWFSFYLGCHRSAVTLSAFLLWLRQLPQCGDWTPASVPPPTKGRSSPTNTPVFPPTSFILPSFAWFYIFFPSDQVLLSAFSWYSACTCVWRYIPDVSMERDVLQVHLLLHHLVLSQSNFLILMPWIQSYLISFHVLSSPCWKLGFMTVSNQEINFRFNFATCSILFFRYLDVDFLHRCSYTTYEDMIWYLFPKSLLDLSAHS